MKDHVATHLASREAKANGGRACQGVKYELFSDTREKYRERILHHLKKTDRPLSCTSRFFDGFSNERVLRGTLAWMLERGEITASLRYGYALKGA
jgi:hypothetical protein